MGVRKVALAGVIAGAYIAVTLLFAPLSYGMVQIRISEALTLLPFLFPEAIPGLFAGCLLANFAGGFGLPDVIFGSAATLAAAVLTARMPTVFLAALPPVLINMVVVGGYLSVLLEVPLLLSMLYVGAGESVACFLLGIPLVLMLQRRMKKGGKFPAR
ncbi:MAG: QueT transporter family protein [Synergistaceae bacterium]|nr:QueT transporter family protein [Synergistaceae bacterium]